MTNVNTTEAIKIDSEKTEEVESYTWANKSKWKTTQKLMILGWVELLWKEQDILCDQDLPMSIGRRVFNKCVLPILWHIGGENWSTRKEIEQKLTIAQQAMKESYILYKMDKTKAYQHLSKNQKSKISLSKSLKK